MGQVANKLNYLKKRIVTLENTLKAPWAQFIDDELITRSIPYVGYQGYCLKDVEYFVEDGILYIKAKRTNWDEVDNPISGWYDSLREIHEICQEWLDEHEIPDEYIVRNFKKRVWFFFHVTYKICLDLRKPGAPSYFKRKIEFDFEYCLHPFKLKENV
jgi:hypothetical protein